MPDADGSDEAGKTAGKVLFFLVLSLVGAYVAFGFLQGETPAETLWQSAFAAVGGVVALVFGFKHLRDHQLMRNTPTSNVRSIAVGAVEVQGSAQPVEEPLVSPLTHREACVYQLEVQRKWESDDGTYWETVLELDERPPFRIDDGTDQVLVDAGDAELEVEQEKRVHVGSLEDPPAKLADWAAERGLDGEGAGDDEEGGLGDAIGEVADMLGDAVVSLVEGSPEEHLTDDSLFQRRYIERVIGADETTYVLGGAYPRNGAQGPDNASHLVIREHEGTGEFILSDRPEEALAEHKLLHVALLFTAAAALIPPAIVRVLLALNGG